MLWSFIKKNWKWLLGILGAGIGAVIAGTIIKTPVSPKLPEPDTKKLEKEAIKKNSDIKKKIDLDEENSKKQIQAMTPEQVVDTLPSSTQKKIEGIKDEATKTVVGNIMARLDKEAQNG